MVKICSTIIFFLLFIFSPFIAQAATLSISPATGNFEVGSPVTVRVIAASNVPFNAVSGSVSFPTSLFSIESVSKSSSFLNFWVTEPTASAGTVRFEGVALGGFTGSTGTVVTVNLRAIKAGVGTVSFNSGQILANDGQGTDITGNLNGANFSVKAATPKPTPPPKPIPTPVPEPEIPQPEPTLRAPEIMLGDKYGMQAILGTSEYPKAQVLVTFISEDGTKVFILGVADADGSFDLLVPHSLKHGSYTITAMMIKEDKTNSESSNIIVANIGNIISDIPWWIWLLIFLLIICILYLLWRSFKGKNRI